MKKAIINKKISSKDFRLLCCLLYLDENKPKLIRKDIDKFPPLSVISIKKSLANLSELGYVKIERTKSTTGRFAWNYTLVNKEVF